MHGSKVYTLFPRQLYRGMAPRVRFHKPSSHRNAGRIYALDIGADHHNPECNLVGEKHKHKWNGEFRDKQAYVPEDITETWDRPMDVWKQFCAEDKMRHRGNMFPPAVQKESRL